MSGLAASISGLAAVLMLSLLLLWRLILLWDPSAARRTKRRNISPASGGSRLLHALRIASSRVRRRGKTLFTLLSLLIACLAVAKLCVAAAQRPALRAQAQMLASDPSQLAALRQQMGAFAKTGIAYKLFVSKKLIGRALQCSFSPSFPPFQILVPQL